jgi:nucleoside-diphosphate-sugar epimerase
MKVLVTGCSGFIGQRLVAALLAEGHSVICAGRTAAPLGADVSFVPKDFRRDVTAAAWAPCLDGVDAVINAAGIIAARRADDFELVHVRGPRALFDACVSAGVPRLIQLSALGADAGARSQFHTSKRAADDYARSLPLGAVIVQPSLVYGRGGASAALFGALASAPITLLPGDGSQLVQPVHVDDVVRGIAAILATPALRDTTIAFVGPGPLSMRDFLARLRATLGFERARCVRVPLWLLRLAARFGAWTQRGLLRVDTLAMLTRGSTADAAPFAELLGHAPRGVERFVEPWERAAARRDASLHWLLPLLRVSIAIMWLVSGLVSLGPYPVDSSLALLAAVGLTSRPLAAAALYGAAVLDIALGVGTLVLRKRRLLWLAQIAVVMAYTVIISVRLPHLWLEPFGPILKNLPVLAALWLLYATEERRWTT